MQGQLLPALRSSTLPASICRLSTAACPPNFLSAAPSLGVRGWVGGKELKGGARWDGIRQAVCGAGTPFWEREGVRVLRGGCRKRLHTSERNGGVVVRAARRGLFDELKNIREEKSAGPVEFDSPLSIVLYPDPRLRAKNKKILVFDERLQELVAEMFDVMYKTDGVGLSAPQVGVNVRLMVYNPKGERGKGAEYVLVNPRIVNYTKDKEVDIEGCLSFPSKDGQGLFEAPVERAVGVKVEAQDLTGRKFSINLKDFQARIFQHEYDHLEGTLFHDRMTLEVLQTVSEDLEALEEAYAKRTSIPSPEKAAARFEKVAS